jgi:rare lipoprotein A
LRKNVNVSLNRSIIRLRSIYWITAGALVVSGCSSVPTSRDSGSQSNKRNDPLATGPTVPVKQGTGYYDKDGPPQSVPIDLAQIADAVPRDEPLMRRTNQPYQVFGVTYTPMTERQPLKQRGIASWYGKQFHSRKTSSGEVYDMLAMTAAHPTLPIPSYVRVTNLKNNRQAVVRVNDRGPFLQNRLIDLSYAAAAKLGYTEQGHTNVEIEVLLPGDALFAPPVLAMAKVPNAAPTITTVASQPVASAPTALVVTNTAVSGSAAVSTSTTVAAAPAVLAPSSVADSVSDLVITNETVSKPSISVPEKSLTVESSVTVKPATPTNIYLQIAAFSSMEVADSFADRIGRALPGWASAVGVKHEAGLSKVRIGPYADKLAAASAAESIYIQTGYRPFQTVDTGAAVVAPVPTKKP